MAACRALQCAALVLVVTLSAALPAQENEVDTFREPRTGIIKTFLPYFNLRFVTPFECTSNVTINGNAEMGTCMSTEDCTTAGGRQASECADGYGACCVFEPECGESIERNRTVLIGNTTNSVGNFNCQYTIKQLSNDTQLPTYKKACQVRLDFDSFTMEGPDAITSLCTIDYFEVTGSPAKFGKICGSNTGQHIYLPVGASDNVATLTFSGGSISTVARNWRIRVTYLACDSDLRAPAGCLQYFTEPSGTIDSFNYPGSATPTVLAQIGSLQYSACISSDSSTCGVKLSSTSFVLSKAFSSTTADVDADCEEDSIGLFVRDATGVIGPNTRFCGSSFAELSTYAQPFAMQVTTNGEDSEDELNIGFSMAYSRLSC